jgi:ABC-type phosphate transport system substrate-binding protein
MSRLVGNGIHGILLALACVAFDALAAGAVVDNGHAGLGRLDTSTLQKIYTGKVIELDGIPVTAINAHAGSELRNRFLSAFLNQDEDRYTAYWTVRRYIGKGASPREMPTSTEVINFVKSTPGAIGYIDESDLQPGLNVLLKQQ